MYKVCGCQGLGRSCPSVSDRPLVEATPGSSPNRERERESVCVCLAAAKCMGFSGLHGLIALLNVSFEPF